MKHAFDIHVVENNATCDQSLCCYSWDIYQNEAPVIETCYRDWIAHNKQAANEKWVIISENSMANKMLYLFLDAVHLKDYPDAWYKYPCICTEEELIDIFEANHIESRNVLLDTKRFIHVKDDFDHTRGAMVYREITTGYLFYLDNFHKYHYEVFDSTGKKHLGIANRCMGKLIPGTAEKDKQAIL